MKAMRCWLLVSGCLLLAGCNYSYKGEFESSAKKRGWTEDEIAAAHAWSYRLLFTEEDVKDKEKLVVKWRVLPTEWIRKTLEETLDDIDAVLSYQNEEESRYVDFTGTREYLLREEKRLQAIFARIRAAELHDKFRELTGDYSGSYHYSSSSSYAPSYAPSYYGSGYGYGSSYTSESELDLQKGFAWKVYLNKDLREIFQFRLDKIDAAKKQGQLKQIERSGIFIDRKFDRKEQDPAHLDDPNAYLWRSRKIGLEICYYKVLDKDKPENNKFDYAEAYRIKDVKDLRREKFPCIKAFNIPRGVVLVIDADKEGEPGYGVPDKVMLVSDLGGTRQLFADDSLVNLIFQEDKHRQRVKPKPEELFVEVARVGVKVEIWEDAPTPQGWPWPLFKYKNKLENNYNVKLEWEKVKDDGEPRLTRRLKSIKKEWTNGKDPTVPSVGEVVEYYHIKPPYDGELVTAEVRWQVNTKTVRFVFKDGTEETVMLLPGSKKVIEEEPFAIEYTMGEKRYRIEKVNSKVFNKRKEIAKEGLKTGVYRE